MPSVEPQYHARSLYIDVEMSCWSGPPPPGMKQEIIEIGVAEMNLQTLQITREASYFVRPRRWEISKKCTDLTGITADDIQTARPFLEVMASLTADFSPSKALCCAWGNDAELIASTCEQYREKSPLRNLIDLASLFHRLFLLEQQASLRNAIRMLGLQFDGIPHGALADARNTARVHAAVLRRIRQEPDPPPVTKPVEAAPRNFFAEKLSQCIQLNPSLGLIELPEGTDAKEN